jgi:hypothetical protein
MSDARDAAVETLSELWWNRCRERVERPRIVARRLEAFVDTILAAARAQSERDDRVVRLQNHCNADLRRELAEAKQHSLDIVMRSHQLVSSIWAYAERIGNERDAAIARADKAEREAAAVESRGRVEADSLERELQKEGGAM